MKVKNKALAVKTTLSANGRLLDLSRPQLMGILNITPDSFYAGSRSLDPDRLVRQARNMVEQGVAILDVGGASSRPGASIIDPEEEMQRVLPLISALNQAFPKTWISIDTYHSATAEAAIEAGACLINDISGGELDPGMMELAAKKRVPLVVTHMQGRPQTMQDQPQYEDLFAEIMAFFTKKLQAARDLGLEDLILDPGFGFGKTLDHNFQLLCQLDAFRILGKPLMAGLSRKSMICRALDVKPEQALNGTTALHMIALQKGVSLLRVHDAREARECLDLHARLEEADPGLF